MRLWGPCLKKLKNPVQINWLPLQRGCFEMTLPLMWTLVFSALSRESSRRCSVAGSSHRWAMGPISNEIFPDLLRIKVGWHLGGCWKRHAWCWTWHHWQPWKFMGDTWKNWLPSGLPRGDWSIKLKMQHGLRGWRNWEGSSLSRQGLVDKFHEIGIGKNPGAASLYSSPRTTRTGLRRCTYRRQLGSQQVQGVSRWWHQKRPWRPTFQGYRTPLETQLHQDKTVGIRDESKQTETNAQHERESFKRTWMNFETSGRVKAATSSLQVAAKMAEERAKARARTSLELQSAFHGHQALACAENFLQELSVRVR